MDGGSSESLPGSRDVLKATGRDDQKVSSMAERFAATSEEGEEVASEAASHLSG
jgi:hypothetical protein